MNKKFNNAEELNQYLEKLEKRIKTLENENAILIKRNQPTKLPETNVVSKNFLSRAFAIWGHFFTAHILISIIIGGIYLCVILTSLGLLTPNIKRSSGTSTPAYVLPASYLTQNAPTETATP